MILQVSPATSPLPPSYLLRSRRTKLLFPDFLLSTQTAVSVKTLAKVSKTIMNKQKEYTFYDSIHITFWKGQK